MRLSCPLYLNTLNCLLTSFSLPTPPILHCVSMQSSLAQNIVANSHFCFPIVNAVELYSILCYLVNEIQESSCFFKFIVIFYIQRPLYANKIARFLNLCCLEGWLVGGWQFSPGARGIYSYATLVLLPFRGIRISDFFFLIFNKFLLPSIHGLAGRSIRHSVYSFLPSCCHLSCCRFQRVRISSLAIVMSRGTVQRRDCCGHVCGNEKTNWWVTE